MKAIASPSLAGSGIAKPAVRDASPAEKRPTRATAGSRSARSVRRAGTPRPTEPRDSRPRRRGRRAPRRSRLPSDEGSAGATPSFGRFRLGHRGSSSGRAPPRGPARREDEARTGTREPEARSWSPEYPRARPTGRAPHTCYAPEQCRTGSRPDPSPSESPDMSTDSEAAQAPERTFADAEHMALVAARTETASRPHPARSDLPAEARHGRGRDRGPRRRRVHAPDDHRFMAQGPDLRMNRGPSASS